MKRLLIFAIAVMVSLPVMAGSKAEHEDWMKHAREKETKRAQEAAKYNGDIEHLEKKYGWLKKEHPEKYAAMVSKRQAAAKVWQGIAAGIPKTKTHEEISALKEPAYKADAAAELARLELKAAGAEKEWSRSAEKTGSAVVAVAAKKLIANQRAMLEETKKKMESDQKLRELARERSELEKKMRTEYEKAKKAMHSEHRSK